MIRVLVFVSAFFLLKMSAELVNISTYLEEEVDFTDSTFDDAKNWCSYLQKVPEPPLLLYNRLSKCGSTTMQMLFAEMSTKNNFGVWDAPQDYWRDLDIDKKLRKQFLGELNEKLEVAEKNGTRFLADGHWYQTTFSQDELDGRVHENIQLLRECKSRRHSKFFYGLFDSKKARQIKDKNDPHELKKFEHDYINSDLSVKDCVNSYKCLKGSAKFDHNDTEIIFLCGSTCEANNVNEANGEMKSIRAQQKNNKHHQNEGDIVSNGAMLNIHNPKVFTIIGILDYMEPYLEMLECIYPSMMNGIHDTFVRQQVHGMEGSHASTYTPAMERILNEACNRTTNAYLDAYDEVEGSFLLRYKYMKSHYKKCCRIPEKR